MIKRKKIGIFLLLILLVVTIWGIIDNKGPMNVEEYVALGNKMGVKGNHVAAGKAFKDALKIDPYYVPAYLGLGTAYGNSGRGKEAIVILREGIKLSPTHNLVPQMQISIASIAYNKMNDGKTAIQFAKEALQIYTDQGDYVGVALAGQKLKQYDSGL